MADLKAFAHKIDARTVKERALLLAAGLLTVLAIWELGFNQPLSARRAELLQRIAELRSATATTLQLAEATERQGKLDPDTATRAELERMREEIKALRAQLASHGQQLVPPADMAGLLETVLIKSGKLSFVGLTALGTEPLRGVAAVAAALATGQGPQAGAGGAAIAAPAPLSTGIGIYRHGLRIELGGAYLDVLAYLRDLEALRWKFLWDSVEYEVEEYPNATRASITVYTLSLDPAWIGL